MNLRLETIDDPARAAELSELLERAACETGVAVFGDSIDAGAGQHFLDAHFASPYAVLVVAEAEDGVLGLAATAPFIDPLTGATLPMLTMLYVDPSIRQRGVARALVAEVRRRLRDRGRAEVVARAGHNDDALISMGERWGLVRAWELMSSE